MKEKIKFKKMLFLMTTVLGIFFLFYVPSYANDVSVPIEMNLSNTGEQDFPGEWDFLLKFREVGENGKEGEILNEYEINALPDKITWNSSQGTHIDSLLEIPGRQKMYSISIFNKDPNNLLADYDQSGWEYDNTKYFLEMDVDNAGTYQYKIFDKDNNEVNKIVFNHTYNRSKTYTSKFNVKLDVRQGNTATPPSKEFQFEFKNLDEPNQPDFNVLEIVDNSINANGAGTVEKVLNVKINVDDILAADSNWTQSTVQPWFYTAVFKLKLKNDAAEHWEYDNNFHYILLIYDDKRRFFDARLLHALGNDATKPFAEFTNTYTAVASSGGYYSHIPTNNNISIPEFTKNHIAYIKGYPDATVRPTGNITRAETATMIYRLLTDERRSEIKTDKNTFRDVRLNSWYHESVSSMAKGRYIVGYPDGTFRGDQTTTRAEFVAMLVRFIEPEKGEKVFSDVNKNHWAYNQIGTASAAGWISGYEEGKFAPDKSITRAEVASILNRVLNRGINEKSTLLNFKNWQDNPLGTWYYYEIIEAGNSHEYKGTRPSENWTKILD